MVEVSSEFLLRLLLRRYRTAPDRLPAARGPGGRRVVVLAPHIDDETISCGGVLHQHVAQGDDTTVLFLTDGSRCAKAGPDIVARREAEANRAVEQILGVGRLVFWRCPDQGLGATAGLEERLYEFLRELAPDLLYVPSAWDPHPDHVCTALLAIAGARHVGQAVRIYESFCPLTPQLVNRYVDISAAWPVKAEALKMFASQVVSFRGIALLNRIHAAAVGRNCRAAEVFLEVPPDGYGAVCVQMASTPIRPRRISQVRNVLRAYATNFLRARRLARELRPLVRLSPLSPASGERGWG